jgi:hypothetical protein
MSSPLNYEKLLDEEGSEDYLLEKSQRSALKIVPIRYRAALLLSLLFNTLFFIQIVHYMEKAKVCDKDNLTEYGKFDLSPAPLENQKTQSYCHIVKVKTDIMVPYDEGEESLYDPVWNSPQMSDELGVVALGPEYIKAMNLPSAMRYPWDESKHVYVLSFHHNIHCLVSHTYQSQSKSDENDLSSDTSGSQSWSLILVVSKVWALSIWDIV